MLYKGFTGIAIVTLPSSVKFGFRFSSADFSLVQGLNVYLPSYGGQQERRIISPTTGDITGRISTVVGENLAQRFYDLVYLAPELTVTLYYYSGKYRKFGGTKAESLTFDCKAGELVTASFDFLSLTELQDTDSIEYNLVKSFRTDTQKLLTWDKTGMSGVYSGDKISFSYTIKNNLVTIKTAKSLLPRKLNKGIQEVTGNLVIVDAVKPPRSDPSIENAVFEDDATFYVDDWTVNHRIAAHWSFRTPLTPETVLTTLEWTRVDQLT